MKTSQKFEICDDAMHEKGSSSKILIREKLCVWETCSRVWFPAFWHRDKKLRIRTRNDILERSGKEPAGLNSVIAGDGWWIFKYDHETERQSLSGQELVHPIEKQACQAQSWRILIVLFKHLRHCTLWIPSSSDTNYQPAILQKRYGGRMRKIA